MQTEAERAASIEIRNPAFIEPESAKPQRIDCEINSDRLGGWVHFTAAADDTEEYGRIIHARALALGPAPYVPPDPAVLLAAERARMSCTPLQGRLALGEALCGDLDVYLADPETPWAVREAAKHATVWNRTSPMIAGVMGALGISDEQADDLFRTAMQIEV